MDTVPGAGRAPDADHERADDRAGLRARQQAAVAELGVRALAGLSLSGLRQEAAQAVADALDVEFVKILELLPDGQTARIVAGVGWREGVVGNATIHVGRESQAGYALLTRAPVVVDDLRTEARLEDPPLLREHGVVSGISVILYGPGGSSYGVLGAHTARRRRFTSDDLHFLQGIANVLSAAATRRQVEDQLREAHAESEAYAHQLQEQALELEHQMEEAQTLAEELEHTNAQLQRAADRDLRLLAVAAGLSTAVTPEQVAAVILRDGLAAIGADAGALALVHTLADAPDTPDAPQRAELEIVRTVGYPDSLVAKYRRFPLHPGRPLSDAVVTREPQLVGSRDEWRRLYPDADSAGAAYEAFAAIPIVSGGRVIAGLSASFLRPVEFDEATRAFLATLGGQCGLALERARAYEAERRARQASAFLAEASRLLAASLDYEATLRALAAAAVPRLADWCAVDVLVEPRPLGARDPWPPAVQRLAVAHEDPAKVEWARELEQRIPQDWSQPTGLPRVLREGVTEFYPDIPDELLAAVARTPEELELLRQVGFRAAIVVPLVARRMTLGALTLVMADSGRRYDEADRALAEDLAHRAATAVDNARLYREAERARADAEDANQAKSQFLATMSHELRTPLNAIAGHAELIALGLHGPVSDAQREALERITRAQRHLLGLINDVLNYARLESGRVEYDVRPVLVADVVHDVLAIVGPQIAARDLALEVRLPEDVGRPPVPVWADKEKLAQILINLLSNAAKFTPSGRGGAPGRITVELVEDDAVDAGDARPDAAPPEDRAYLRVCDTGVGVPAEKLDTIFEPFVQVRSELTREAGGTGLGLAISRDLARGMGGELRVRSTVGKGSTFIVVLRRADGPTGEGVDRRTHDERRTEEERRSGSDRRDGEA
ncbi:ATP-binding region ATPase domain protein (plasmid) [Gemmatirosa kalamazoonensis]|uniref:histidine kinase n=1 Tax=Gemmatirosa kalamazoonensis TaxID=861299 RepID=W0RQL8_9BACT|nr:GAF domain-containing protein [Gemmatirosa kalamazoonensis]AHG92635.1 ATP-binding region ATPase domain protein [Gemmatirosa kalamazoonensis]